MATKHAWRSVRHLRWRDPALARRADRVERVARTFSRSILGMYRIRWRFPLNAIARCSWTPEESQVETCEHQDNANIHCQPFPESVSEEHEINTDYDGCQALVVDDLVSVGFGRLRYHSGRE